MGVIVQALTLTRRTGDSPIRLLAHLKIIEESCGTLVHYPTLLYVYMRALTAEQRADREHEARVRKWSQSVRAAQQAVNDHKAAQAKIIAKNEAERVRIEAQCNWRNNVWADQLEELEKVLDKTFKARPTREVL